MWIILQQLFAWIDNFGFICLSVCLSACLSAVYLLICQRIRTDPSISPQFFVSSILSICFCTAGSTVSFDSNTVMSSPSAASQAIITSVIMVMCWTSEWAGEWVSEWVSEWMSEWVNEWVNEWVRTNDSEHNLAFRRSTNAAEHADQKQNAGRDDHHQLGHDENAGMAGLLKIEWHLDYALERLRPERRDLRWSAAVLFVVFSYALTAGVAVVVVVLASFTTHMMIRTRQTSCSYSNTLYLYNFYQSVSHSASQSLICCTSSVSVRLLAGL